MQDLRREIMQGMISVHCEACNCEGTEQLDEFYKQTLEAGIISIISQLGTTIQPKEKTLHLVDIVLYFLSRSGCTLIIQHSNFYAPVAQWIEQWFPVPCAGVRFPSGVLPGTIGRSGALY